MKLAITTTLLVVGVASATSSIPASSRMGQSILTKARLLNNDNNNNNNGMIWAANYSLRFEQCITTHEYYGGYFGGNQDQNNDNRAGYNGLYQQRLVHFKLCPTGKCGSGCSGGADYVVDMNEFIGTYLEYKTEIEEAECEAARANCNCENANDDQVCENQCLASAGLTEQCSGQDNNNNNNNGQQQFNLQEALECRRLEVNNNNNNNNQNNNNNGQQQQNVEYFVGPYCSTNGKNILLGVFMDETCSYTAPTGTYEKYHYGSSLPYSKTSLISHDCISCKETAEENNDAAEGDENNANNENANQASVKEVCQALYNPAGKCETNLKADSTSGLYYKNTLACNFIQGLNPWGKTRIAATFVEVTSNITDEVLVGIFAATTVFFGITACLVHSSMKKKRAVLVRDNYGNYA